MRAASKSAFDPIPAEPLQLALAWQQESRDRATQPDPDAMVLATVDARGYPTARVVLCKAIVPTPGYLTFFSNYQSAKARELETQPRAAAVMHWPHLQRQVRIEGPVTRASAAVSDEYFNSRHWLSRVGAWASQQSQPIDSRATLLHALDDYARRFGVSVDDDQQAQRALQIPRPPHWGGYHLWAESVELWVAGEARLHDRLRWTRELQRSGNAYSGSAWAVTRLQP
jgi:pyridoxamine 5'-phosphate oxidase